MSYNHAMIARNIDNIRCGTWQPSTLIPNGYMITLTAMG